MTSLPVVVTATNTSGLTTTANAVINVTDSTRGLITAFNPTTDNWQQPDNTIIDGQGMFAEHAGKTWSFTKVDNYTVRFEVRPGDLWADDATSRSEIATVANSNPGDVVTVAWKYMIEPGTLNTNLAWCSSMQLHQEIPFASVSVINDHMNVILNQLEGTFAQPYVDPNPLVRGRWYDMKIEFKKSGGSDGYFKMWRDGVMVANYTGDLGDSVRLCDIKFGIYQGWPEGVTSPMAAQYRNIAIDIPPPPPPPPLPSGLNNIGETAITGTADNGNAGLVCAQKVTLSATAQLVSLSFYVAAAAGNLRLGLYATNAADNNPGSKIVDVGPLALSGAGWKTISVTNGPTLQPGNYWLAFEVSSNSAGYRTGSGGSLRSGPAAFGTMPATFPTPSYSNDSTHWSFYMTVNVP